MSQDCVQPPLSANGVLLLVNCRNLAIQVKLLTSWYRCWCQNSSGAIISNWLQLSHGGLKELTMLKVIDAIDREASKLCQYNSESPSLFQKIRDCQSLAGAAASQSFNPSHKMTVLAVSARNIPKIRYSLTREAPGSTCHL